MGRKAKHRRVTNRVQELVIPWLWIQGPCCTCSVDQDSTITTQDVISNLAMILIFIFLTYFIPIGRWGDLWVFDLTSGFWTWLSGSSTGDQNPVYGTKGQAAESNQPGSRGFLSMNIDPSRKLLFLYGGTGHTSASFGVWKLISSDLFSQTLILARLNDLWSFELTSGWWTWLDGTGTLNAVASFGAKGLASASNRPGSRTAHSMVINTSLKLLFLYGGRGYATTTTMGMLN